MDLNQFQTFLDINAACFLSNDFNTFEGQIALPFTVVLRSGTLTMTDREALSRNFHDCARSALAVDVDQIVRRAISAEDCGDGTMLGTYETHLLRRGYRVFKPFTSTMLMRWTDDGVWKLSSILNAHGPRDWVPINEAPETAA